MANNITHGINLFSAHHTHLFGLNIETIVFRYVWWKLSNRWSVNIWSSYYI